MPFAGLANCIWLVGGLCLNTGVAHTPTQLWQADLGGMPTHRERLFAKAQEGGNLPSSKRPIDSGPETA
jgi:hypothetical protein